MLCRSNPWPNHCGYRRYFNQGLSHHCELVVTGREEPLARVYTCGEIGLCTPCRWAHPIYGVGPSERWVEAGGGALGAPADTHHSDGILSHLSGEWRREGGGRHTILYSVHNSGGVLVDDSSVLEVEGAGL